METFAQRFVSYRNAKGISQEAFANLLGISRNYVSMIEGGKEPSEQIVRHFSLLENSATQASYRGQQSQSQSSRLGEEPARYHTKRARLIPVVSFVQAGQMSSYEELPRDWLDEMATDCPNQKAFGLIIRGESMAPQHPEGNIVTVCPGEEPWNGCLVVAKLKDDSAAFKMYHRRERPAPMIQLTSFNPAFPPMEHSPEDFEWIWPAWDSRKNLWR